MPPVSWRSLRPPSYGSTSSLPSVRFAVNQPIHVPRAVVEAAFSDPDFYPALGAIEVLDPPQVVECRRDPHDPQVVHLRVRYAFTGHLARPVRAVIDPAKATWVDHTTVDRGRHQLSFRMVPEHYQTWLTCWGTAGFEVDEADPQSTIQAMSGEVQVHYPVVGALVERGIVLGLRQHLAEEARILEQWSAPVG